MHLLNCWGPGGQFLGDNYSAKFCVYVFFFVYFDYGIRVGLVGLLELGEQGICLSFDHFNIIFSLKNNDKLFVATWPSLSLLETHLVICTLEGNGKPFGTFVH